MPLHLEKTMSGILRTIIIAVQLLAAETGAALYIASFLGYPWNDVSTLLLAISFVSIVLSSIPASVRDRRFFKHRWGLSIWEQKNRFAFQPFPARRVEWLNPLGWSLMGVLALHFFWIVLQAHSRHAALGGTSADLRLLSLIVAFGGVGSALSSKYPPTELPRSGK